MKKADLRSGMIAETRDGKFYTVICNVGTELYGDQEFILAGKDDFLISDAFRDDLTHNGHIGKYKDVVRIYKHTSGVLRCNFEWIGKLLWTRHEPKKMTLAEIEHALGYPIEIIDRR